MDQSHGELQRLFRLLAETALKLEQDAYTAGWRDCRNAMIKAMQSTSDVPPSLPNTAYRYEAELLAARENLRFPANGGEFGHT